VRFAAWLAWSSFSLFLVLVAFDLLLGSRTAPEQMLGLAINGLLALPFPAIGAVLASRRPDNPIGWLFCVSAILLGLSDVGGRYALEALVAEPGALPGGALAAQSCLIVDVEPVMSCRLANLVGPSSRLVGVDSSDTSSERPASIRWGCQ